MTELQEITEHRALARAGDRSGPAGSPAKTLAAEFGASVGNPRPLREHIERTDELIDAIVYRLYGLSEEEIRIVEGGETS